MQLNTITSAVYSAVYVLASLSIIDSIAVADIEYGLGTVPPDGVLDEPRKGGRELRVEFPRVDPVGNPFKDLGTAAGLVTAWAIGVQSVQPVQDPGSVQEVVHQGVDCDHGG